MELLERETQLRELEAALHDAVNGAGRLALVSGEAGIGKTALVERFAPERRADVRVLWGACDALFTPRPLGPLHDMAGQLGGEWPARLSAAGSPAARTARAPLTGPRPAGWRSRVSLPFAAVCSRPTSDTTTTFYHATTFHSVTVA
jgi:predicted ATPase